MSIDYIDVEKFKRKLIDEKGFFPAIVARALEEMPVADVAEVVRCRDCKFYEEAEYYHPTDNAIKTVCRLYKRTMQEEDFCSYGKRRE